MLSILVLGLAKLSLIFVLSGLTPVKRMLWTLSNSCNLDCDLGGLLGLSNLFPVQAPRTLET